MESLPESDRAVCDQAAQTALANLFARYRAAKALCSTGECLAVAEAARRLAQTRTEARRRETAFDPDPLPYGPSEADQREYESWLAEYDERHRIMRESEDEDAHDQFHEPAGPDMEETVGRV
jgi:hypothetical protein